MEVDSAFAPLSAVQENLGSSRCCHTSPPSDPVGIILPFLIKTLAYARTLFEKHKLITTFIIFYIMQQFQVPS